WMDHIDAETIPWMSRFVRNPVPDRVVWKQDDVPHQQFYLLAVEDSQAKSGSEVTATLKGQQIDLQLKDVENVVLRFDDRMVDLDQSVRVTSAGKTLSEATLQRRIATLAKTLTERDDPDYIFASELTVSATKQP